MKNKIVGVLGVSVLYILLSSNIAFAHCDTLDGPVVVAAKKAIETENVNIVLVWVKKSEENKVKELFQKTIIDRKASPVEKDHIDMLFFENLVRIHRAGEGESFEGLKPVGTKIDPIIIMADKAVEIGSVNSLLEEMNTGLKNTVQNNFKEVLEKKNYKIDDVDAGRDYIESYVKFLHYVEGVDAAIKKDSTEHHTENNPEKDSHFDKVDKGSDLKDQLYFSWAIIFILVSGIALKVFKGNKSFRNK